MFLNPDASLKSSASNSQIHLANGFPCLATGCCYLKRNNCDWYQSDTYQYIIMKGGSYYHPGGSWWYVQGGPKPLHYRQMLLRVSQGFERNATVGFRCVKNAE